MYATVLYPGTGGAWFGVAIVNCFDAVIVRISVTVNAETGVGFNRRVPYSTCS
jgi:hypothetical protein